MYFNLSDLQANSSIYQALTNKKNEGLKQFAVLIDPDKYGPDQLLDLINLSNAVGVDYFLVGGSLMTSDRLEAVLDMVGSASDIPSILFPGSPMQINGKADGILFLSLISGRNPEMLIGHHVVAAPYLKATNLEVLSTGYMLVDSGRGTTASYMSNTTPIPADKPEIAACTAMAGEMLGLKLIYLDGGSGAQNVVNTRMIHAVSGQIEVPLIIGGGITNADGVKAAWDAGADLVVVGNALENNPDLLKEIGALSKVSA